MQGLVRTAWSLAKLGHMAAGQLLGGIIDRVNAVGIEQVMKHSSFHCLHPCCVSHERQLSILTAGIANIA